MKTKTKMWLGVGAFAVASAAGVSMNGGKPNLTLAQPVQAADGTCGWERSEGRWIYDQDCGRGERFINNRSSGYYYYRNQRNERWNGHDNGYHRGWERGERGRYHEQGERWGERGERWGG
jgi:hypothetical protein